MFRSVQQKEELAPVGVDMAPLIDVVFILLIFFLVTATFVRETGVRVTRPQAASASALEPRSLRASITAEGMLFSEGRELTDGQWEQAVRSFVAGNPQGAVVLIPDEQAAAGRLIGVMDAARLAGAQDVAVATRKTEGR